MNINLVIAELYELPHLLNNKQCVFFSPIKANSNPDANIFYNIITKTLLVVNAKEPSFSIINSTTDMEVYLTDSMAIEKIVSVEKERHLNYLPEDKSLGNKVENILFDFIKFDTVKDVNDPLSKAIEKKQAIGYLSPKTNHIVVHDIEENDLALVTSMQLAIIFPVEKLVEIRSFLNHDFIQPEIELSNKKRIKP